MKTTIWATIIENVVQKGRNQPILHPKRALFPGENANLANGTHFTRIGGGWHWGQRGKSSPNAVSLGKRLDNKILKVQI